MSESKPIRDYMRSLSDDALMASANTASIDLAEAAETQRDTEWHQSCFAAAVLFAQEMGRRGLKLNLNRATSPRTA